MILQPVRLNNIPSIAWNVGSLPKHYPGSWTFFKIFPHCLELNTNITKILKCKYEHYPKYNLTSISNNTPKLDLITNITPQVGPYPKYFLES